MDTYQLIQRLAVALAIGLIIGIERGWKLREEISHGRAFVATLCAKFDSSVKPTHLHLADSGYCRTVFLEMISNTNCLCIR